MVPGTVGLLKKSRRFQEKGDSILFARSGALDFATPGVEHGGGHRWNDPLN